MGVAGMRCLYVVRGTAECIPRKSGMRTRKATLAAPTDSAPNRDQDTKQDRKKLDPELVDPSDAPDEQIFPEAASDADDAGRDLPS